MRLLLTSVLLAAAASLIAQPANFSLKEGQLKKKIIYLVNLDTLLSDYHRDVIAKNWEGLEADAKFNAKNLSDTSSFFISVVPAEGHPENLHLVAFQGAATMKNFKSDEPWNPKWKHIASLHFNAVQDVKNLMPTYLLALKNLINAAGKFASYDDYYVRHAHEEWIGAKEVTYIFPDRLVKPFHDRELRAKIGVEQVLLVNENNLMGATRNVERPSMLLDHRIVQRGENSFIQIYIYEINKGLRFFIEEPKREGGQDEITRAYMTYLFRAEQGEPMIPPAKDVTESKLSKPKVIRQ